MADLIELDVVVRNKGLKASLSTIERLERQIIKAQKAVDQNTISQERYNKVLLSAKREYEALGVSSQKATSVVRKFAAANKQAKVETIAHNVALNSATVATNRLNAAQYQTKNRMNSTNMAIQQVGYQFGDFAVQVQSGTSAFVAFSQQATQLAGILPMIASQVGLTVGVATILSSALMILIPIGSAIGRMFMEMGDSADEASKKVKTFEESLTSSQSAITAVDSAIQDLSDKSLESLRERYGQVTTQVLELEKALKRIEIKSLTEEVQGAMDTLFTPEFFSQIESSFGKIGSAIVETTEEDLQNMKREIQIIQQQVDNGIFSEADLKNLKEMRKELAAIEGNFEKAGSLVDELSVPQDVLNTYLELELTIKEATKAGNFTVAADGISSMRKLFEDLGIEVENGALANMTRLEGVLREANGRLIKGTVLTRNMSKEYVDIIGSEKGLRAAVEGLNKFYESRMGTIDDTANEYVDIIGSEEGLEKSVDALNQLYQDRLDKLQATADSYDDILGSERGLAEAEAARLALTQVGDSGYAGGRGGDPRDFTNLDEFRNSLNKVTKETKKLKKGMTDAEIAAEKLRKELQEPMVDAIESVSNAFGDFIANGLKDFKGFASSILDSFKNMIAQMIATAARNKIMLSLGLGGVGFAKQAAAGQVAGVGSAGSGLGMIGNVIGSFAGGGAAGSGFLGGFGAAMPSFLGGAGNGLFAVSANAAAAGGGLAASIGALAAPLLAVTAVFSFLRSKTKELDSGLRVTVDNMDVLVKTFRTIQKSRFWGLSKKVRTTEEEASSEVSDPIVNAVATIQESVMEAASAFGVASDKFDDFTYDFEVSLKGLTEDQKLEKLNEEFTKLGDSFTEMSGLFTNMNDLMTVYQQRLDLENQLLVAQGDVVKLRELELETIHVLNRDLATRIHLLQAEGDTQSALTAFASGISEQQGLIRRAVDALVKPLQDAIDRTRTQAEKSYNIFKTAADKSVDSAKNIVDIITSALDSRTIRSESAELLRYQTAQKQLASFAGGASFDEASLRRATEGVSIDSQKFFGSFEDYARDFYRTQINLEDLADVAEKELSEVEQQIDIAQKAYEVAIGTHQETVDLNAAIETLAQDLNIYEATKLANEPLIKMVQDEGNRQIELLDSILVETTKQVNTQLGIESSMADLVGNTVSIGEAMGVLGLESESLSGGVLALEDIERDINGNVTDLGLYIVDFDGSVKKLDESVFNMTGTVDNLDGDITSLFNNISLLDGAIDNLDGGVDSLGVKVGELGLSTGDLGIDVTNLGETLTSAMTSLGSIVSTLSNAVSDLSISNDNLATAQQKAENASKISSITTTAAGVARQIGEIETSERGAGTPTAAQQVRLDQLRSYLQSHQYIDKEGEKNRMIAATQGQIDGILASVAPADMSPEDSATLVNLLADLEDLRVQIRDLGGTPTFSSGGYHSGGMRLVGESGPELEATGPSRIYSAQQTRNMLSGGSGEVVVELRSLRREVSELKAEQRKVGVENVKYNKKSYDLYREWDTVGLPATRTV